MALTIGGQMYFMQNQTKTIIAIVWPNNVALKLTATSSRGKPDYQRQHLSAEPGRGEREVEPYADGDKGGCVEQRHDEKHLRSEHGRKLRLPGRALEKPPAEQAHADTDGKRGEPHHDAYGQHIHTNHEVHLKSPVEH
jgi:hypothetical protein